MSRILLINDSRFESAVIKDILRDMGNNVVISDEYDAMKKVGSIMPDYVIVNNTMRDISGDQLITMIKVEHPGMRCILFSNNPIKTESFRYRKVDAFFQTPTDRGSLHKALEQAWNREIRVNVSAEPMHSDRKIGSQQQTVENAVNPAQSMHFNTREFCPYCGNKLGWSSDEQFAFCPYCGRRITI